MDQPLLLCLEIIEARNYKRAYEIVENAKETTELDFTNPFIAAVWDARAGAE